MIPTNSSATTNGCDNISSNCVIWQGPDISCIDLCNGDTIVKDYSNKKDSKVYNILLEDDNGKLVYNAVNANNMICESLSPCVYGLVTNKFKFEEKLQEEDKNNIEDYNEHRLISLLTV